MVIQLNGMSNHFGPKVRDAAQESALGSRTASSQDAPASATERRADSVQLSREAQQLYQTENTPSFDEKKVAELRQQIEEGRYSVDPHRLAHRLLDLESQ